ncbi:MAG TPA: hypothetical protein VF997_23515 [Polyangia bacterium]
MIRVALIAFALAAGCAPTSAVVNGQRIARPTLGYTDGYYYAVTHYRAYPENRGASTGLRAYGGRLAGFACGADFTYESDYYGRSMRLTGFVQPSYQAVGHENIQLPAHIEVADRDGRRYLSGSIGDDFGTNFVAHDRSAKVIEFSLGADGLHGQIASRFFDLAVVDADTLAGTMRISTGETLPFELHGLTAMWSMPAADQAAILPYMLSCSRVDEGRHMEGVTTETTAPLTVVKIGNRG